MLHNAIRVVCLIVISCGHVNALLLKIYSTNNITAWCHTEKEKPQYLELEIRPNKKSKWISIAHINVTQPDITKRLSGDFRYIQILSHDGKCLINDVCDIRVKLGVQPESCLSSSLDFTPILRCHSFDGIRNVYSSQEILSVEKGEPPRKILPPSVISREIIRSNDSEAVIVVWHLQCHGEVETFNGQPSQDIRWCEKVSGKFRVLTQEISPNTSEVNVSTRRNGCGVALQNSTIKYVLSNSDSDVEIMCESGYLASNEECGNGSAHPMLYIPSINPNKGDKMVFYDAEHVC